MGSNPADHGQIHFVTGKLAEPALRSVVEQLSPQANFRYTIQTLNITVAALMTVDWISKRIQLPPGTTKVMVTGFVRGDIAELSQQLGVPVERGPKDVRQLPDWFHMPAKSDDYGAYDIEIIAEINHAPSMAVDQVAEEAMQLAAAGADVIDLGCNPGTVWNDVADYVRALKERELRVSIDSLDPREIQPAVQAGAELVLSVNSSNSQYVAEWGCEVVVIPDDPKTLQGFDETIELLSSKKVPFRLDPILEPMSFGFAESLVRYYQVRQRYPQCEMMMGIGNLTELTDVDSAGLNVMLLGFCQEVGIRSVLTTQVINWARTSVRECDLARRMLHYAATHRILPKRLENGLITLRDGKLHEVGNNDLEELASQIKDDNYRIFAAQDMLHLLNSKIWLSDADPFQLFDALMKTSPKNINPSHAFYLGYELCKAKTAIQLSKNYTQDESLDWGYLTQQENSHRVDLSGKRHKDGADG